MIIEAIVDMDKGVRVGGELLKYIKFADDQEMVTITDGELTRNNDRRAKKDRERVCFEDKCQKDQRDESLQEWKQMTRW